MSGQAWRVDETEQSSPGAASQSPALVTMHFLLTALRRRWHVWVGLGCVGMLLGLGWAMSLPPTSVGTVTLLLAHDPGADPQQAISTDVSLLRTRTLAGDVVDRLGLDLTAEEFQQSVVSNAVSSDVLVLDVTGPDEAAAVARARELAEAYLAFRAAQIRSQEEALTGGYIRRVVSLREESRELQREYDEIRPTDQVDQQRASQLLQRQAQVATLIDSTQESIRDAALKSESVIEASVVLDPASAKPGASSVRTAALAMASGLIGATGVGVGIVLVQALTSSRLRLREEIALALDAPVRVSVEDPRRPRPWQRLRRRGSTATALDILVGALDREVARQLKARSKDGPGNERPLDVSRPFPRVRLALATVDTEEAGWLVMGTLADRLSAAGLDVFVADLSKSPGLEAGLARLPDTHEEVRSPRRPVVYRPDGVPSLSRGPTELTTVIAGDLASSEPLREQWEQADVALTLAEVDPAVGVEHVPAWADDMVVLVTAGRSSAERLRTTGELVRAAGLRMSFAMVVGRDRTDESPGLPRAAYQEGRPPGRGSQGDETPHRRDGSDTRSSTDGQGHAKGVAHE